MNKLELWFPVRDANGKYTITQHFGENLIPLYAQLGLKGHNGIDAICEDRALVRAAHDGIAYTGKDSREGLGVVIITKDQREYNGSTVFFKSIYWHLLAWAVKDGQEVKVGDVIGYADNTGASTATHLHFGLKPVAKEGELPWMWYNLEQDNGYMGAIDPAPYFNGAYADKAQTQYALLAKLQELYHLLASYLKGRDTLK